MPLVTLYRSASQFAWHCCNAGDFPPPESKRGNRYGADAACCLCGGEAFGVGWPRSLAIADTFTDVAQMPIIASQTVCQSCAATSKAEGWGQYVTAHPERGLPAFFPAKDGKKPRAWNWLYSHHLFVWPHHHECPDRNRWRALLSNPPQTAFIAIVAPMGKRQLIFKSTITHDPSFMSIQMDDEMARCSPQEFSQALSDFERLYCLGFSKDGILTANYHNKTLLDVGLARWKEAEAPAIAWRAKSPALWALCHYVAQRPEGWEPPIRMDYRPNAAMNLSENMTPTKPVQPSLF